MSKALTIFICFSFCLSFSFARNDESLLFRQISTKDGLSQNTVRSILIDKKGFLWAGTLDGLNRYDGSRFIVHKPQIGVNISLSDHRVRSIFEDKKGFIWVRKYDNSFSCYNPVTETFIDLYYKNRTVNLSYTNFLETSDGSTWLWDNKTGCVRIEYPLNQNPQVVFMANSTNSLLTHHTVDFIFEDSKNNIWIGTQNGLNLSVNGDNFEGFYKNSDTGTFRKALEMDGIVYFLTDRNYVYRYNLLKKSFIEPLVWDKNCQFLDIAQLGRKEILLTTRSHGLLLYNAITNTFNNNPFPSNAPIRSSAQLIVDSRQGVWIFDHSGILRHYLPETGKLRELHLIPSQIASVIDNERYVVFIDSRGVYWITTYGNGLFQYEPTTGFLENYRYNAQSNSPASDYLLSITEDESGNIWVGSEYAGIIKVIRQNYKVRYLRPEKEDILGSSNNVKVVFEDSRENVWVGTKNGSLYLYDKHLEKSKCIHKNLNPYTIIEDDKNQIWIGTKGNGVYVYDLTGTKQLHHFVNDATNPKSLSHNSVFNILQDRQKRIWIASFGGGLDLLNQDKNGITFTHFFSNEGNKSYIRYLFEDSQHNIWTGSYEGLICFYPDDFINNPDNYKNFHFSSNNTEGLNCNDIKTIYEDKRGNLWIGTAGGGLNLMVRDDNNSKKNRFVKFTTKQGLPSDVVTAILESPDSVLWISTENGICQFDYHQQTFMTYQFSERTHGNYYNENACAMRQNGEMLWGTLDGFRAFNPGKFIKNSHVPPVVLTDLFVYDERVETNRNNSPLNASISMVNQLKLTHLQNTFTLHFASLNLTDPKMNQYTYIMEPYDKFWSTPASISSATYKNLPPGSYTFKVKGSNADGQWNNEVTELEIIVTPPFWRSNLALVIYFIVAVALLFITFLVIFKISNLNNAVRIEKQLTDYKLRFFTNISHEFRTPLTLIRGAVESLSSEKNLSEPSQKQVALLNRNTRQMTRLIDQLLEFRKIQNNVLTLNLELTDFSEYMHNIYFTFKEIATTKNINYTLTVETGNWELFIDHNKVEKIIFNLLSNAFKFTPNNGTIHLSVDRNKTNGACIISVKDSGIGIPKEKQHLLFSRFMQIHFSSEGTGVGLSLVKEFTEAHKGRVWYEENPEGGSVFKVELPGDTTHYKDVNYITPGSMPAEHLVHDGENDNHPAEKEHLKQASPHEWKILIIDDNKDIREFLSEELGKHFITETAENGKIGLDLAITGNPDLIICDVKMPEMDGFEVTTRLKNDFQTSHIPVILLTALSSDAVRLKGSECGADAYIMKPFSLRYLLSRVYKLIEQREKLKKRFSIDIEAKESLFSNTNKDKEFYLLVNKTLDANISRPAFSVEEFTELCGQKRTVFYKKIKGLTGYSPNDLIKIKRMKKAAELLLEGKHTVAEVSWQVGIEDPFYFSKCFKAQFGCSPSKYTQGIQENIISVQ